MQTAFARRVLRALMLPCAAAVIGAGCATPPAAPPPITAAERNQRDQSIGTEIARQFDAQLKFRHDEKVAVYLRGMAQALAEATPELRAGTVQVLLLQDSEGVWRDYSLPGHRIYLSSSLLKRMQFENQIAAAMAYELAHILRRHALTRVQEEVLRVRKVSGQAPVPGSTTHVAPVDYASLEGLFPGTAAAPQVEYLGPSGIFAYPDDFHVAAAEDAVEIMYRAGYDPRGLVSLWNLYASKPAQSPFGPDLLPKLMDKTRRVIALHSPLRNPIVRSETFLTIQKRIQRL